VKNQDPAEEEKKSKTATSHLCTQIRSDFCRMCFWDTKIHENAVNKFTQIWLEKNLMFLIA
jgi:hypothetical protein